MKCGEWIVVWVATDGNPKTVPFDGTTQLVAFDSVVRARAFYEKVCRDQRNVYVRLCPVYDEYVGVAKPILDVKGRELADVLLAL